MYLYVARRMKPSLRPALSRPAVLPLDQELYPFVELSSSRRFRRSSPIAASTSRTDGRHAIALLARYRNKVCCYNDDIQGTGGVTLAGLINALKITGGQLKEQRVLFGAGSAAIGLADLIVAGMGEEQGVTPEAARQQIRMFDTQGLVVAERPGLAAHKRPYAQSCPPANPSIISTRRASARRSSRPSKISSRRR